jgi:hypothetical protein
MQRDMTKVATLVNVLRAQGIEVGTLKAPVTIDSVSFAAGSYVVKLDQPYGRLAKNLLEKQDYPDRRSGPMTIQAGRWDSRSTST